MKIITSTLCVVILLLCFASCSANSLPYQLRKENDTYYLAFQETLYTSTTDADGHVISQPMVCFESLSELKQDVKTGNFSQDELAVIQSTFKQNESGIIQICNIDKLYEPTLPIAYPLKKIRWFGQTYSYYYNSTNHSYMSAFDFITKEEYDTNLKKTNNYPYTNYKITSSITVESIDDRNATVYTGTDKENVLYKYVYYSIVTETKTLHVCERYNPKLSPADGIPFTIDIFGKQYGQYFHVRVDPLTERPTVEWLSQFGIREYVETVTE